MSSTILHHKYDSYRISSHSLIDSLKRFITSTPKNERTKPEFLDKIWRQLHCLHTNGTFEITSAGSTEEELHTLLAQYVELEFDVLYSNFPSTSVHNNHHLPSKELEQLVEQRVLKLLQVMLYKYVLGDEVTVINGDCKILLNKSVLEVLAYVRSEYFTRNRFVSNLSRRLLRSIGFPKDRVRSLKIAYLKDILLRGNGPKTLSTSDYGSDDDEDTDLETNVLSPPIHNYPHKDLNERESFVAISDDEEGDNLPHNLTQLSNHDKSSALNTNSNTNNSRTSYVKETDTNLVIICSDSEDEPSNSNNVNVNKKKSKSSKQVLSPRQNEAVVTFEILDDDEDDSHPNYIVYLQRQVDSSAKSKNVKRVESQLLPSMNEVIVCSDSDSESLDEFSDNSENKVESSPIVVEPPLENVTIMEFDIPSNPNSSLPFSDDSLSGLLDISNINHSNTANSEKLIDPSLIFANSSPLCPSSLVTNKKCHVSSLNRTDDVTEQVASSDCDNGLGGPILGKMITIEDVLNLQEFRLSDSLLDELILNNSYLTEENGEFDDLESFLFRDQEKSSSNNIFGSFDKLFVDSRSVDLNLEAEEASACQSLTGKNCELNEAICAFKSENKIRKGSLKKRLFIKRGKNLLHLKTGGTSRKRRL